MNLVRNRWGALTAAMVFFAMLALACTGPTPDRFVVVDKPGVPVVYYRLMISAGSALDPEEKPGLAYLTANLLDKGTTSFSREEIARRLEQIGAELNISIDKEVVVISGRTLAENAGEFYAIFREVFLEPTFPEDQVRQMIAQQLDAIGQVREDDARLSLGVFENTIFAGHRYGHIVQGAEKAVRDFQQQDAVQFYRANYLRGNVVAGIAGAVEDSLVDRFRADVGQLPSGRVVRSDVMPQLPKTTKVVLVEKENRAQSNLRIGHALEDNRLSPQYYPMALLGCYLGQHREMFGRLFQTVRAERGLAYGAYAYIEHFRQAGWSKMADAGVPRRDQHFLMWTYPKEINFEFCIKLMLHEMTKLTTMPLKAEDIDRTKDFVANSFAFRTETADQMLGMQMDEIWYGQIGFVDGFRKQISSVPRSELQTIAIDNLHPPKVTIVAVVSNGEAAKQELLSLDTKLELPSGSEEGELKAINDEIKALDLKLKAEDIEIVKASEVFR